MRTYTTIAQLAEQPGSVDAFCNGLSANAFGIALGFIGFATPLLMVRMFNSRMAAPGIEVGKRAHRISTIGMRAKGYIRHMKYRSAFENGGKFDENDGPIEKLQNAYARGQIDMEKFEILVAGAICKEEGYDKELLKQEIEDLLNQEIDDSDTEDN